jgi:hypothetical protein
LALRRLAPSGQAERRERLPLAMAPITG